MKNKEVKKLIKRYSDLKKSAEASIKHLRKQPVVTVPASFVISNDINTYNVLIDELKLLLKSKAAHKFEINKHRRENT